MHGRFLNEYYLELFCVLFSFILSVYYLSLLKDDVKEYSGPSPAMLLEPLFKQSSCSYRVSFMSQFLLINMYEKYV